MFSRESMEGSDAPISRKKAWPCNVSLRPSWKSSRTMPLQRSQRGFCRYFWLNIPWFKALSLLGYVVLGTCFAMLCVVSKHLRAATPPLTCLSNLPSGRFCKSGICCCSLGRKWYYTINIGPSMSPKHHFDHIQIYRSIYLFKSQWT